MLGEPPKYSGMIDAATKIVNEEGVRALYKGMSGMKAPQTHDQDYSLP